MPGTWITNRQVKLYMQLRTEGLIQTVAAGNHDALSLLCTVTVSLSRSIYLPALRSTDITPLQHYYG
ncbi:hypothetical protein BH10PSE19_BH10PSE19_00870 [soil metagenome]